MTTNWKQTETANGAGARALHAASRVCAFSGHRHVRALRWKRDAVCGYAAADAEFREGNPGERSGVPAEDSTGASLTRTIFFSSRIQTQPSTRKETLNTTQKKKGKQTQNAVTIRKKLETLA